MYLDLYRLSYFLGENLLAERANKNMAIIKESKNDVSNSPEDNLLKMGFDDVTISEIIEYQFTKNIVLVDRLKAKVAPWIQNIILPDFFDLTTLKQIFIVYNITQKKELIDFLNTPIAEHQFLKENTSLLRHFVEYSSYDLFPYKYCKSYENLGEILLNYKGEPILGNFHNHTKYSDGKCSIADIVSFAKSCNREYVGISDHSQMVGGISSTDVVLQHKEIDMMNDLSIKILKSIECEICKNGDLDLPNDVLDKMDYIIAAVHSFPIMKKNEAENRLVKAIENPRTNILAHPSSRILHKRVELYVDMYKIIDACIANNVAIEINGDPCRLDLDPKYIDYALNRGAYFTLDSDTHSLSGFMNINNAIEIAQDVDIPNDRILNTFEWKTVQCVLSK